MPSLTLKVIDGVVVARAELGIKMRTEQAFWLQKPIIRTCNLHAIPCLEASHFLDSMNQSPKPRCAESTDL